MKKEDDFVLEDVVEIETAWMRLKNFLVRFKVGKRKCKWCSKGLLVFTYKKDHTCIECDKLIAIIRSKALIIQAMLIHVTKTWEGKCRICDADLPIYYEEVCKKCRDNYDHFITD